MLPSSESTVFRDDQQLPRFSRGERWVHRSLGILMGVCMVTAALLYVDVLSALVGRRDVVSTIHVVSGLLLPVPLILGWVLSQSFRRDVSRLNRFRDVDWQWLRRSDRREARLPVGKFNAGQKLNSAFVLGAIALTLITGAMMRWFEPFDDATRTGATFVHDVTALALVVVTLGHIGKALADSEARVGMRTGSVSRVWAEHEHRSWAAEFTPPNHHAANTTDSTDN